VPPFYHADRRGVNSRRPPYSLVILEGRLDLAGVVHRGHQGLIAIDVLAVFHRRQERLFVQDAYLR
jgi:hypothetical protein